MKADLPSPSFLSAVEALQKRYPQDFSLSSRLVKAPRGVEWLINLGSKNPEKLRALEMALDVARQRQILFKPQDSWHVNLVSIPSGVSEQPLSIQETTQGALNRAAAAYNLSACQMGVGVESGIQILNLKTPGKKKPNKVAHVFTAVALAWQSNEGLRHITATSGGIELPSRWIASLEQGVSLAQLEQEASQGLTDHTNGGYTKLLLGSDYPRARTMGEALILAFLQLQDNAQDVLQGRTTKSPFEARLQ